MKTEDIRNEFDKVIANTQDKQAVAELEICREFFTNPDFKAKLEDFVWEANQCN